MRSRHAYIRQAAHRPAPPRRVVPTHPGPHPTPLADRPSPTASRTVRVPALTRPPAPRIVTVRATDACPAPAGKPATQPTNQNSTQVVLDNAVPHQLLDETTQDRLGGRGAVRCVGG